MVNRKIEVFGSGCAKCQTLEKRTRQAADELGIDYELSKITDMLEIVNREVYRVPALAIDGKVVLSGDVPTSEKIKDLLQEGLNS
ncbi:MAG: thioredoxin family protein [Candidatus Hodarchaeota archaeon]